jgi:hypothetical protein
LGRKNGSPKAEFRRCTATSRTAELSAPPPPEARKGRVFWLLVFATGCIYIRERKIQGHTIAVISVCHHYHREWKSSYHP